MTQAETQSMNPFEQIVNNIKSALGIKPSIKQSFTIKKDKNSEKSAEDLVDEKFTIAKNRSRFIKKKHGSRFKHLID